MQVTPEWAPNIHPMIVHFPIALLTVALIFDFLNIIIKKSDWFEKTSISLYIIGTISIIVAFISGRAAADSLDLPSNVITTLIHHADWAEYTVWFFGVFTLVRIILYMLETKNLIRYKAYLKPILFLIGAGGFYLVFQTADHGAKMVYGYGLGTGNLIEKAKESKDENSKQEELGDKITLNINLSDNGSWKFYSAVGSVETLKKVFNWNEGSVTEIGIDLISNNNESFLKLKPNGNSVILTYGEKFNNLQAELRTNLDSLEGAVMIVHHFVDNKNYDFVSVEDKKIMMGRVAAGKIESFDKGYLNQSGWLNIKLISSGTHFRTYINGEMLIHGHGEEVKPGPVGLRFFGNGNLLVSSFDVQVL